MKFFDYFRNIYRRKEPVPIIKKTYTNPIVFEYEKNDSDCDANYNINRWTDEERMEKRWLTSEPFRISFEKLYCNGYCPFMCCSHCQLYDEEVKFKTSYIAGFNIIYIHYACAACIAGINYKEYMEWKKINDGTKY